jgi:pimeloyl-ACP methyl ester carboxylesterase
MTRAYEEHGAGPAVLLLHGISADSRLWKSHIQPLMLAGYRVIVPNLRGFGEGSTLAGDYSIDVLSDDVIRLLNYLGIGRAAIVGLSLGTHVLQTLLQRYPNRLAAAVNRTGVDTENECLMDLVSKRRVSGGLLDFLNGVKRFRPRCQLYRQVA